MSGAASGPTVPVGLEEDTDSEDELPSGWEERVHSDGRVYFACHSTQSTQWTHPKSGHRKIVPKELPYGWNKIEPTDPDPDSEYRDSNRSKQETQTSSPPPMFLHVGTGKTSSTDPRLAFARKPKDSVYDFTQRFDSCSTALHILNGINLSGRVALITGANAGIGFETARSLALHGCEIIFACRSESKAKEAMEKLHKEKESLKLKFVALDLCSLESVKNCANEIKLKYKKIDMIILNAGIFGCPFQLTVDNYEQTFQTNHLSQFYLILELKSLITGHSSTRILILSSESHRMSFLSKTNISESYLSPTTSKSFLSFTAYNDTKLCNLLITGELNRRWSCYGVTTNSLHPGNMVSTEISRNWWFYRILFTLVRPFTKSLQQASATAVWGAVAPELEGVSGQYLNNCWLSRPDTRIMDLELCEQLWDLSVEMIERKMGKIRL